MDQPTSKEFNQRVKTLASLSPSASNSSISGVSVSSTVSSPGCVLNKCATKAKFNFGLPETSARGVKYFLQPNLSALSKIYSALCKRFTVCKGCLEHKSGDN